MKKSVLSGILLSLVSCGNNVVEKGIAPDSIRREVILDDSLGVITFTSPMRYDTSFAWIHYSDCNTCHEHKYRTQSKKYPILKESGWFWDQPIDSVDRFTITHSNYYFPSYDNDSVMSAGSHNHYKTQLLLEHPQSKLIFDTVCKINDRDFSIVAIEKEDSLHSQTVFATTSVNSNEVRFSCELIIGSQDSISRNFLKSSINLLNSIKIINGKAYSVERTGKIPY